MIFLLLFLPFPFRSGQPLFCSPILQAPLISKKMPVVSKLQNTQKSMPLVSKLISKLQNTRKDMPLVSKLQDTQKPLVKRLQDAKAQPVFTSLEEEPGFLVTPGSWSAQPVVERSEISFNFPLWFLRPNLVWMVQRANHFKNRGRSRPA